MKYWVDEDGFVYEKAGDEEITGSEKVFPRDESDAWQVKYLPKRIKFFLAKCHIIKIFH